MLSGGEASGRVHNNHCCADGEILHVRSE